MLKRWKDASIEKDARGFKDSSYNIYDTWRCREFLCFRSPRWKTGFDTLLNGTSGAQVSAGFAPPGAGEASVDWKTETSNQQVINGETTTAHSNQPKEPSTQGTLAEANMPAASTRHHPRDNHLQSAYTSSLHHNAQRLADRDWITCANVRLNHVGP